MASTPSTAPSRPRVEVVSISPTGQRSSFWADDPVQARLEHDRILASNPLHYVAVYEHNGAVTCTDIEIAS